VVVCAILTPWSHGNLKAGTNYDRNRTRECFGRNAAEIHRESRIKVMVTSDAESI